MIAADDRFYLGSFNFRRHGNADVESVPLYTYESHERLYDVLQLEGVTYYRINMGGWSTFPTDATAVHRNIVAHFGLAAQS